MPVNRQCNPREEGPHSLSFRRIARSIPFLACLSEGELRLVEAAAAQRRFARNEMILSEEDTLNYFYFVSAGKVKVVKTSIDGSEHIIAVRGKGDFFGEMGLLDGKTAPATVIAMEDCEIALLGKADFHRLLMSNEKVLRELIVMLSGRLREAWFSLRVLRERSAEHRVRAFLQLIGEQHGIKDSSGILIAFKLSHREIADYACLSRETVSRSIRELVRAGEIEMTGGRRIFLKREFFRTFPDPC